ncbi:9917_t:CDS:2 [Gigaspora margarita]|uniref:9917_t:CDS:1 n=1 Tax=Gigaspora margarita TaxID=4874 RepID=A0ABN7V122_GIGMA|nr:9917_t:CDS:2 [Gigaspora margarita]
MKFLNLFAYTVLIAFISSHSAEAQSAAAAPSPTSAANTASSTDLPTFNYSLTQETPANREQLCASNKAYCSTNCGDANNFCNNETMGWGCGCSNKVPDFQGYQWPINYADCVNRGQACKAVCQSDATPADKKIPCNQACSAAYSDKCGSPSQPACYYNTSDINTPPTYTAPLDNSKNSTSGAFSISSAISALTIVAAGMMML